MGHENGEAAYASQLSDTVFIVDDDPLVLRQLAVTLAMAGFQTVKFTSAERFLDSFTPRHSGCLLTDIHLPGQSGLELQQELARRNALLSVIVMSGHADVPVAVRAMKAGALEILEKPFRHDRLVALVRDGLEISRRRAAEAAATEAAARKIGALTGREQDVLGLVVQGRANKEIARQLHISPRTVEVHRARLMEKLGVDSVVALVRLSNAAERVG
jgi:two-component system response regulator FixJ